MPIEHRYTPDINGYKEAVWHFLLEHSEITKGGKIFVKFHTDDKRNFENRVLGRWKYNYHREDVHAKEKQKAAAKREHEERKRKKKEHYKAQKALRLAILKAQKNNHAIHTTGKNTA